MPGFLKAEEEEHEGNAFISGEMSVEGGSFQPPQTTVQPYVYSRLVLESHPEIAEGLSLNLEGKADAWAAGTNMPPSEPEASRKNLINFGWESADWGGSLQVLQLDLDRANLHWATGPLDLTVGLFRPEWGSAYFYRPTNCFYPTPPLSWLRDEPIPSEGADASLFLFDDLNLEGAVRWLEGGNAEGVVRLAQRGIGLTVTPSIAWLADHNNLGLEIMGTFPTFQVRFEGVDRLYPDGHTTQDWNLGFSTSHEGLKYTAEVLRDGTGEIFADGSGGMLGTYVFISAEGAFVQEWKASPALVAPLEGGPILFWPKVTWAFEEHWEAGVQAQVPLGNWAGPLHFMTGRVGISLSYSF